MNHLNSPQKVDLCVSKKEVHAAGGFAWNDPIKRRKFLKNTGGATLATFILSHSLTPTASAGETGDSGNPASRNCPWKVMADPDVDVDYSPIIAQGDYRAKMKFTTVVHGGAKATKKINLNYEAWNQTDYEGTKKFSNAVTVFGEIGEHDLPTHFNCKLHGEIFDGSPYEISHVLSTDIEWYEFRKQDIYDAKLYNSWGYKWYIVLTIVDKGINDTEAFLEVELAFGREHYHRIEEKLSAGDYKFIGDDQIGGRESSADLSPSVSETKKIRVFRV